VALKFIDPAHDRDPDRRARLLKEAQAAAMLRPPAVATTYDIGEDDGTLFIVMELVEGETLVERLRHGPLSVRQALGMTLQIADALDEAHGLGIIHRDIKAANLELGDAGAHQSLARAYWIGRGDIVAGIAELERAIAINPDLGYADLQLGLLYALRGNLAQAEPSCKIAVDLQERVLSGKEGLRIVGAHTRLGYVYYLQGQPQRAIPLDEPEVTALNASDHALKERSLIELHVKLSAAHRSLNQTAEADQHFAAAVTGFERRLARGADDPATKYYIATLYGLRSDVEKAVRYLRESITAMPALNRSRASVDPDFDPIRNNPAFADTLAVPLAG
jgi:tetratricopeptide (TPR) repeat protein